MNKKWLLIWNVALTIIALVFILGACTTASNEDARITYLVDQLQSQANSITTLQNQVITLQLLSGTVDNLKGTVFGLQTTTVNLQNTAASQAAKLTNLEANTNTAINTLQTYINTYLIPK